MCLSCWKDVLASSDSEERCQRHENECNLCNFYFLHHTFVKLCDIINASESIHLK